jgi:7,8-dihydro-6-hydroxymethylpterin dimethyltransferase
VNIPSETTRPTPEQFANQVAESVEPDTEERSKLAIALEKALTRAADLAWPAVQKLNQALPVTQVQPKWAPAPLLRKKDKTFPQLGFPRETDSLCPHCVKEVRTAVLSGEKDLSVYVNENPGEIKARIVERDGKVLMEKECPKHGRFEDVMALDAQFLKRIESLFPGRDFLAPLTKLRNHGTSSVKYGRGAVLTVDLTNRCNMMCDPCFMDANQVGYVHELSWDEIKQILDDAVSIKPKRQMSIQFSGGEPTLSPYFLDAIRYARQVGYFAVQCATNGVMFAQDPSFAKAAKEAGLRMAYLQFDGVTNEANSHRKVGNLFDVKLRAIENLHAAGIDVILVVTVVNGINNDQVGPIVDFAIENADKITVVSFQPVSFTGRDEDVTDARRHAQRYTLSHLAKDLETQTGAIQSMRDWFPLSSLAPFADLTDVLLGENAEFGAVNCGCHPNCGIGTVLFVNKRTKEMVPLTRFLDLEQLMRDVQDIADGQHGKALTVAELVVALLRNFKPDQAPTNYGFIDLVKQFMSQTGARGKKVGEFESDAAQFEWRALFVAGMWFQDLFNYDFRRTEMCIIPYGTQMGEISFCAYNTGVGWRQIIEKMKANASVAEWYREKGRHPVYAKNQALPLPPSLGTVTLPDSAIRLEAESKARRRLKIVS